MSVVKSEFNEGLFIVHWQRAAAVLGTYTEQTETMQKTKERIEERNGAALSGL